MHGRGGHWDPRIEIGAPFAGFGGPRVRQISVPAVIEAHNPFDHPIFTNPFGGLPGSQPFGFPGRGPLMNTPQPGFQMGGSPFILAPLPHFPIDESPLPGFHIGGHSFLNAHRPNFHIGDNPFPSSPLLFSFGTGISAMNVQASDFLGRNSSQTNRSKGPIIKELDSDNEKEIDQEEKNRSEGPIIELLSSDDEKENDEQKGENDNPRKHNRCRKEAYAEDQDYEKDGMNKRQMLFCNKSDSVNNAQSSGGHSSHSFTFHSSNVVHGGSSGAHYTKSRTFRRGSDGLKIDESKETDFTTGRAAHRLSRAIHDKGHSVTRNIESDGEVDTMQILHNLERDDLPAFEQAWTNSATKSLPGWSQGLYVQNGSGSSTQGFSQSRGVRVLPSTENLHIMGGMQPGRSGHSGYPGRVDVNNGDKVNSFWV